MKIIYLANLRLPTEKIHGFQIMKMCESFAQFGAVELVVPTRRNPIKTDPYEYYNIKRSFRITRLPVFDWLILEPILGSFAFHLLNFQFQLTAQIYLLFKKFDLIFTQAWTGLLFRNIILELHTLTPKGRHLTVWSARRARAVVVVSEGIKIDLVKMGISAEKIAVLPNGVDFAEFQPELTAAAARTKLGWPAGRRVALYAGSFFIDNIFDWKGVDILLGAARHLPDVHFVILGGRADEVEILKKQYPDPNIELIAKRPQAEVPLYLQAADVLVLPNKKTDEESERYTSPMKLFYYLAANRPIAASDLPAVRSIVSEREVAFFRAGDPEDLALVVRAVLSDPGAAARAAHCVEFVGQYTWEKRAERITKLLAVGF